MTSKTILALLGGVLLGSRYLNRTTLKNKVVLITGGSKGLGFVLAEHLLKEGSKVAICSRDENELREARQHLGEVMTYTCDVADESEVDQLINAVVKTFGHIDVIINNAGVIQVGPMEAFDRDHYRNAMAIMHWGIVNTTFSALPYMKARKQGHIVNITSIGGKVSVPHLLPYTSAKFAAVGFSEGSAAELRKDNIYVTTIVPGLMRTGSYVNAFFQRDNRKEFKLFSLMSTAPLLTVSADTAAARIIKAIKMRRSRKVIGIPARALMELEHFFPDLTTKVFSLVSRLIPASPHKSNFEKGKLISERYENAEVPGFKEIGRRAQDEHQRRTYSEQYLS